MMPPLRSFDDVNGKERGQKKTDDLRAVTTLGPRTLVKLPLALGNIFNWTESIMEQSHDDAKNPYWSLIMDFWHCLIVMTYRNRAAFRFYSFQHG